MLFCRGQVTNLEGICGVLPSETAILGSNYLVSNFPLWAKVDTEGGPTSKLPRSGLFRLFSRQG